MSLPILKPRLTPAVVLLLAACSGGGGSADPTETVAPGPDNATADLILEPDGPDLATADQEGAELAPESLPEDLFVPPPDCPDHAGLLLCLDGANPFLPYPWQGFMRDDPSSRSGLRIDFDGPVGVPALFAHAFNTFGPFRKDLERGEGFGATGTIALPIATPLDPEQLPRFTSAGGPFEVIEVGGDWAQAIFDLEYLDCPQLIDDRPARSLLLHPRRPLKERTDYLVIVRTSATDAAGQPFASYPVAEVLLGVREPYGPPAQRQLLAREAAATQAALAAMPDAPQTTELAAAFRFRTGIMESDLFEAAELVYQAQPAWELELDANGAPRLLLPGEDPHLPAGTTPFAVMVRGKFRSPLLTNDDGLILPGPDGKLTVTGSHWRPFWLFLPAAGEQIPAGGAPLAFVQHGLNSWKETVFSLISDFGSHGFAAAGFDFLLHAKDAQGGFDFIIIEELARTGDHFRQSALDYLMFTRTIPALLQSGDLPLPPEAAPVSFERVVLAGHSLGSIVTSLVAPLYRGEAVAPMLNAGANLEYLMIGFLKEVGLYEIAPCDILTGGRVAAAHLMSAMNPGIAAPYLYDQPRPGHPAKPWLLQVSTLDGTVYPETGYYLTLALNGPLITPCVDCWEFAPQSAPADSPVGTIQFVAEHDAFFGSDGPEIKAQIRQVYFDYVMSCIGGGKPVISWPPTEL